MSNHPFVVRANAAFQLSFIADALAMPVHWFYNPLDIYKALPGGIKKFEAAPVFHPSSIMNLHSTNAGGRGVQKLDSAPQIVGGKFSRACYIDDSWPSLLYLAWKYSDDPQQALIANANLGGDNCHRGAVLGVILGLATSEGLSDWFMQLQDAGKITTELNALFRW